MDAENIFNTIVGILLAILGYCANYVNKKSDTTAAELSKFKEHVAKTHPTNRDIKERFDKIDANVEKLADKVDEKFDKISDKIEKMRPPSAPV